MRVQFATWDGERFSKPTTRQDWPTREGIRMTLEYQFVFLSSFSLRYHSLPIVCQQKGQHPPKPIIRIVTRTIPLATAINTRSALGVAPEPVIHRTGDGSLQPRVLGVHSILGELKPSLSSGSTHIPFLHFLATLLLPCGAVDAKVKKFTGNDLFGEASDDMTRAIHAFVHFSVAYSDNSILFCDLQGTLYSARSSDKQVDTESFIESLYQGPSMQKG